MGSVFYLSHSTVSASTTDALSLICTDLLPLGSQIAYIGSPLVVPTWAILNVLASLVFWIYIVTPALYYSNTWFTGHLPLQSNSIYDNMGKAYNVSRVVNRRNDFTFDVDKYEQYSQVGIAYQGVRGFRQNSNHRR